MGVEQLKPGEVNASNSVCLAHELQYFIFISWIFPVYVLVSTTDCNLIATFICHQEADVEEKFGIGSACHLQWFGLCSSCIPHIFSWHPLFSCFPHPKVPIICVCFRVKPCYFLHWLKFLAASQNSSTIASNRCIKTKLVGSWSWECWPIPMWTSSPWTRYTW